MFKAGVLYPQSTIYPLLGSEFLDGIHASMEQEGNTRVEWLSAAIGFGANEKEIYQLTEKMLLHDQADVIIGFLEHKHARLLQPLFTATGRVFIVVNAGANYPHNWVAPQQTYYITLLNSFLTRLSGKLAVKEGNGSAALAVSFYDGGYLHCHTMVNAFVGAGGSILYNYISPQRQEEFDLRVLSDGLKKQERKIDSLLCLFSGQEAKMFYETLPANEISNPVLYISPMMMEEQMLETLQKDLNLEAKGFIPWHSSIKSEANQTFQSRVQERSKRRASIFSLLGWEAGLLLRELNHSDTGSSQPGAGQLEGAVLDSPRGPARIDRETHYLLPPVYLAKLVRGNAVILDKIDAGKEWMEFISVEKEVPASGWNNIYLCY